mmetsp:Transcript_119225/g.380058  ORF Transcript_119225/g.380058 Transcript_119225/m.380058 type:complete len:267 (-) Transcript_119225:1194-1994(-)
MACTEATMLRSRWRFCSSAASRGPRAAAPPRANSRRGGEATPLPGPARARGARAPPPPLELRPPMCGGGPRRAHWRRALWRSSETGTRFGLGRTLGRRRRQRSSVRQLPGGIARPLVRACGCPRKGWTTSPTAFPLRLCRVSRTWSSLASKASTGGSSGSSETSRCSTFLCPSPFWNFLPSVASTPTRRASSLRCLPTTTFVEPVGGTRCTALALCWRASATAPRSQDTCLLASSQMGSRGSGSSSRHCRWTFWMSASAARLCPRC